MAAFVIEASLELLTAPFAMSLRGDDRWEALVLVAAGLPTIVIRAVAVRWILAYDIPDAAWQRREITDRR